jgi:NTE family protein
MLIPTMRLSILVILLLSFFTRERSAFAQPSALRGGARPVTITLAYDTVARGPLECVTVHHPRRPTIALVLSGGGARGAAQIGVLRAFERHHIPIDFISATSMGAIIGGLYASGYSVAEIESIAIHTNWNEVLSLTDETSRRDLFMEQKLARDRTFIAIRFQGLTPVIPSAVSSGQSLTDWLSNETLQALYHPDPDFDHLKIPFRAIATDLISGKRVVIGDGSLAEAIRASATTPLLFDPIERDSMELIDGGILANVPVDVAREKGYDAVIAVNTTSGLRKADEMKAPWETVDQIMSISMQVLNTQQLRDADIVITPDIGRHLTFDLHGLDSLIIRGDEAAEEKIPAIKALLARKEVALDRDTARFQPPFRVSVSGGDLPDSVLRAVDFRDSAVVTGTDIREALRRIDGLGRYDSVAATVTPESTLTMIRYTVVTCPVLRSVELIGCHQIPQDSLLPVVRPFLGKVLQRGEGRTLFENLLRKYRREGYSLARIDTMTFDRWTGDLTVMINEGAIDNIDVQGGVRTEDSFILKEFQMSPGEVFRINEANRGVSNILSTTLFEYVYLEASTAGRRTTLTIRLKERPSQLVRLGVRADNERHLQGLLDIRDENFHGSGVELGLTLSGGDRNTDATAEYRMPRLFGEYFSLNANAFYRTYDTYLFADGVDNRPNWWSRVQVGEYRDIRYGVSAGFSGQFERLGNVSVDLILQNIRLKNLENAANIEERYRLVMIRAGTVVDSKDAYPFATKGVGLDLSYEFAIQGLGSEIGYNAMQLMYEWYSSWGGRHTIHPRFTMDFADKTMPLSQQFRLGGLDNFFGVREDDRRGRQLILFNLEYRYFLPIRLLFDTYFSVRYDLGQISTLPEEIKFSALRHGIGAELAWRTPVGPAIIGAGKSFYLGKDLPQNPIQQGPLIWYFLIGYQL